jgi:hypothetical protein
MAEVLAAVPRLSLKEMGLMDKHSAPTLGIKVRTCISVRQQAATLAGDLAKDFSQNTPREAGQRP